MDDIKYLTSLWIKLKKLCTYYNEIFWSYDFKIKNNEILIQYNSEYRFKKILVNWIDDISYNIVKNRIRKNFYDYLFNTSYKKNYEKACKNLEKLKKIRDYKEEYYLK